MIEYQILDGLLFDARAQKPADVNCLNRFRAHGQVPDFNAGRVSGNQVSVVCTKARVDELSCGRKIISVLVFVMVNFGGMSSRTFLPRVIHKHVAPVS